MNNLDRMKDEVDGQINKIIYHSAPVSSLRAFLPNLIHLYETHYLPLDEDYRTGEEVYGYASEEFIKQNLYYVSDRWYTAPRIRWMIDLVCPEYIPYSTKQG